MKKRVSAGYHSDVCSVGKTCTSFFRRRNVMKSRMLQFGLVGLVVVFLFTSGSQAALLEWSEGFENGWGGNWTEVGGRLRYNPGGAYEGDYTMYTVATNGAYAYRSIGEATEPFVVTFAIKCATPTSTAYQDVKIQTSDYWAGAPQAGINVTGYSDGTAIIETKGGSNSVAITPLTWYEVKLVIRPDTTSGGTYDVYVDDELLEADIDFPNDATSACAYLMYAHFMTDNAMYTDIDAINVIPEPATVGLLALGMLFLRKRK